MSRQVREGSPKIFGGETRHINDFKNISYSLSVASNRTPDYKHYERFQKGLEEAKQILHSFVEELEEYPKKDKLPQGGSIRSRIERICDRFHLVVRQLRERHKNRSTLEVEDEYDVQDLLHCLLLLEFDDVRAEEWTPSYAGGSARMDFLLKQENIVIEVKKTRQGLGAREVGDQLLIDIGRYQEHPHCSELYCFVYDPEARIGNPRGLEKDLSKTINEMEVKILIRPTGL